MGGLRRRLARVWSGEAVSRWVSVVASEPSGQVRWPPDEGVAGRRKKRCQWAAPEGFLVGNSRNRVESVWNQSFQTGDLVADSVEEVSPWGKGIA